jgi:hypothetical protein
LAGTSILQEAFAIKRHRIAFMLMSAWFAMMGCLSANEPAPHIDETQVRMAVERAIPLLEKAASGSADQRECFTCHSQAIPVLALTRALELGFEVDRENLDRQVSHTFAHLERGQQKYQEGRGQGGQEVTAGYALWTLEAGGHAPDAVTTAVTSYLLQSQKEKDHWQRGSKRPPTSGSPFMTSYLAIRGLNAFGTTDQQTQIATRRLSVEKWLNDAQPHDTEDHVFQLRLLSTIQQPDAKLEAAMNRLLALQREDGGWSQLSEAELASDAYATGTVVAALLEINETALNSNAIRRAIAWLLRDQRDDGSWFVRTRAEGFQEYFESGFPHDEHQFISTSASAWSTLALLKSLKNRSPNSQDRSKGLVDGVE